MKPPPTTSERAPIAARGPRQLADLVLDVRFTLRALRRDSAFAASAIVILAVAIGLNVTIFTIVQAMLFRGLPFAQESDRLAYVQVRRAGQAWGSSYEDFAPWREQARAFEGMAFGAGRSATYRDEHGPALDMVVRSATVDTCGLIGVQPIHGRDFGPADASPGASVVAILSHRFWASRYGGRADIIDTTVS